MKDPSVNSIESAASQAERRWVSRTGTTLLRKVRASDPDGWQRLADLYGPWVYAIGRRMGLDPDDAADITQETFRAIHRSIARFDHDSPGTSFRGWLKQITLNKVRDHWRHGAGKAVAVGGTAAYQRLQQLAAPPEPTKPSAEIEEATEEANLEGDELQWLYRGALELVRDEFTPPTWQAFWETTVEEREPAVVAAELGLTRNAVYIAKSRVLSRLRAELCEVIDNDNQHPA